MYFPHLLDSLSYLELLGGHRTNSEERPLNLRCRACESEEILTTNGGIAILLLDTVAVEVPAVPMTVIITGGRKRQLHALEILEAGYNVEETRVRHFGYGERANARART